MKNIVKTTVFNESGHQIYSYDGAPAIRGEDVLTISYLDEDMLNVLQQSKSIEYQHENKECKKFHCEYHGATFYLDDILGIDVLLLQCHDYSVKFDDSIHIGEVH